jgi:polyisoprenoid-binding protein YceI
MLKRDAIGANATTTIKRSDFKVDKNAPFVSDEVTLTIALEAVRK